MNNRIVKGKLLAHMGMVEHIAAGIFKVNSQTGHGAYTVTLVNSVQDCSCPDFSKRQTTCKHMHAAYDFVNDYCEITRRLSN